MNRILALPCSKTSVEATGCDRASASENRLEMFDSGYIYADL